MWPLFMMVRDEAAAGRVDPVVADNSCVIKFGKRYQKHKMVRLNEENNMHKKMFFTKLVFRLLEITSIFYWRLFQII